MKVAIIGAENSGKTVFVSLLYASMIKFSTESAGNFRFSTNPNIQKIIGDRYNDLRSGNWPKKQIKKKVIFTLGFELRSIGNKLKGFFNPSHTDTNLSLAFSSFETYDQKRNDVNAANNIATPLISEPKRFDSLVRAKIIIVMLDSSKLGRDTNTDEIISKILDKIFRCNKGQIYPIIVYTKFDMIDKKKFKKLKLDHIPPGIIDYDSRKNYCNKIASKYYPNIKDSVSGTDPRYYFVNLDVEKDEKGKLIPKISTYRDFELNYSYDEYKNLIEYLCTIALGRINKS